MEDAAFLDSVSKGDSDKVFDMMQKGQTLDARTESRETAIHLAVNARDNKMLRLLLKADKTGELVDTGDKKGVRPIAVAVKLNQRELFDTLVQNGADVSKVNEHDKTTLLHTACWAGHEDMLELLLKTGAFNGELLEAQDTDGRTALHTGAFRGSEEVCKLLVDAGAQGVASGDKWGNKPSGLAGRSGRKSSKEYLTMVQL